MKDRSIGIIPLYKEEDKYLFLLINEKKGHWGFPKGHPENEESEIETAMREFYEETEINTCEIFDDFRYTEKYSFIDENNILIEKEVTFFLGLVNNKKEIKANSEINQSKWLSYDETIKNLTYENNKKMTTYVLSFLKEKVPLISKRHTFNENNKLHE